MIVQLSKTASEPLKKDVAKTLETTIFSSYVLLLIVSKIVIFFAKNDIAKICETTTFLNWCKCSSERAHKKMTLQFTKTREGTVRVKTGTSATI